jgi:hypothetical protein
MAPLAFSTERPKPAQSSLFPCDLSKFKNLPLLILSGESHDDPGCNADRKALIEKADKGNFALGLEGGMEVPGKRGWFGLEDSGLLAAEMFVDLSDLGWRTKDPGMLIPTLGDPKMSILRIAWEKRDRESDQLNTPAGKFITDLIDDTLAHPSKRSENLSALSEYIFDHPEAQARATAVISQVGHSFVSLARKGKVKLDPAIVDGIETGLGARRFSPKFKEWVGTQLRSEAFAKQIARRYCKEAARATNGKDVYAIMGNDHVDQVVHALFPKGTPGKIPLFYRDPFMEGALLMLDEANKKPRSQGCP